MPAYKKRQSQRTNNSKQGSRPRKQAFKQPTRRTQKRTTYRVRAPRPVLSMDRECAKHYLRTLADPFGEPAGACIPMLPCLDSAKRSCFARGVGYINTSGFGGIAVRPSVTGDLPCVFTTSGGVGTCTTIDSCMAAGKGTIHNSNASLTSASFTAGKAQARIVACGVRVRYRGSVLEKNGTITAFEEPNHGNTSTMTFSDVLSYQKAEMTPLTRGWCVASYQPVQPKEYTYSNDPDYRDVSGSIVNPLTVLISARSPDGDLPFEWEYFCHYEAIGSDVQGKSRSHLAPLESAKGIAALATAPAGIMSAISNHKVDLNRIVNSMIDRGSSTPWDSFYNLGIGAARYAAAAA